MSVTIPSFLAKQCATTAERKAWLAQLPETIEELRTRWSVSTGAPFEHPYVTCSWIAPATTADGTRVVLKVGMPHMEAEQEIDGLRFWNGDGTVLILEADRAANALLLERCEPGVPLRSLPEAEQDAVVAAMLQRLWKQPPPEAFRPLSALVRHWSDETREAEEEWPDPLLVHDGLQTFAALAAEPHDGVLLATDLHAGNVLRAQREPWLVIDPKPFVGDVAYDLTQHLLNCEDRLVADPHGLIARVADLAGVDARRVETWLFARAAAEPRSSWRDDWKLRLAKRLAPLHLRH